MKIYIIFILHRNYTVRLLKKGLSGGYEMKMSCSNGTTRVLDIEKEVYESALAGATHHGINSFIYKVAPQYSYFLE